MKPEILSTPIAQAESIHPSPDSFTCSRESQPAPSTRPAAGRSSASLDTRLSTPDTPRPPGRPPLFTDALVDKICDYIQNTGVSDSAAGLLAGVSTTTLSRWKAENPDFAILLEAARAELQRELITAVREARRRDGSSDWRGAAWLLEHLFPEEFGRRPRSKPRRPEPEPASIPSTAPIAPIAPVSPEPPEPRAAEIPAAPSVPKPVAPEKTAPADTAPPASDSCANLPETPVLPVPGRFRGPRLSNRAIAEVRTWGPEPAETPQLFPKCPASPLSPVPTREPSTSSLFPKLHPNDPTPLAGPMIPPVVTTASATAFD